jgi:phasin family protein
MFFYSPSSNPAVRSHLESQLAWFNDLNRTMSGSLQSLCEANLKLGQTMIEESMSASQKMLSSNRPFDAMGAAASHAQPASDKLRAYQQHLSRLAAEVQGELSRVAQQHGPETARTAHALADEVTRAAEEERARSRHQQEEVMKTFRDPFEPADPQRAKGSGSGSGNGSGNGNGHAAASPHAGRAGAGASSGAGASMQFDGLADNGSVQGHVQGPSAQPAQREAGKPREPS